MLRSARIHPAAVLPFALLLLFSMPVSAATVWTDWTRDVVGTSGSAFGTVSGVSVSYTGEVDAQTIINGTDTRWNPSTSFVGGTSTVSPLSVGDGIALSGAAGTNTITFSSPVVN